MRVNKLMLCQKANNVKLNIHIFGNATVESDWKGFVKTPSFSRLYYIVDGKASIEYNNRKLNLLPGNWYLLPAGLSFTFRCDDRMEHLYFHITLSDFDGMDLLSKFTTPVVVADNTKPHVFYKDYLTNESLFTALALKEKVYNVILKLMEISGIKPEKNEFSQCVQKAIEFINNNLSEKQDLTTIAQYAYVSKCTLTNKFKNETKITVHEYIQRQKMFIAGQLLKNTELSVAQISERLGFSEQFYFSRCFKQNYGLSPREFRKSKMN